MKRLLCILDLFSSGLRAQVAPPDLRCLEVLGNGNVKLTWIPPSDPNNQFFSYQVYASNNPSNTFTLAGTLGALGSTTFVHSGNANGTSLYYFVRTRYNSAGADSSGHSDTLRSIFLNLIPASMDLKLTYNHLKQPKLPSSSSTFTIQKEYPLGTWNIFATTQAENYADTIMVCGDSMSYQVYLPDEANCTSISNRQKGKFFDQKPPNKPFVDSISVLPNGQTVLAWRVPHDIDINEYWIYLKQLSGFNFTIDTSPGRNTTLYTYTNTLATTKTVGLYVASHDTCNNLSTFNDTLATMYLLPIYNTCGYKTTLFWNAYRAMPTGVKEYWIYYSVNGGAFQKVGSTTDVRYVHSKTDPGQNVCYFVRAVNNGGSITSSSNRVCFFSRQPTAANYVYIKKASVTANQHMHLELLVDTAVVSKGIELQRSTDGQNFENLKYIPTNGKGHYAFDDTTADVEKQAYYYRAFVRDSCGNLRTKSLNCRSVHLKVEEDQSLLFTRHLSWNAYEGYGGAMSGYYIYRIVNDADQSQPIGFTDAFTTEFTDELEEEAALGTKIDYKVEAVEGITNPFNLRERSFSNSVPVYTEGMVFVPNAFAPTGVNTVWLPVTHFVDKQEYSVQVFDRWGHKVFETQRDDEGWTGDGRSPGIYVYLIRYKNSRGEYLESKGYLTLLR